jgi:hypothetical protein
MLNEGMGRRIGRDMAQKAQNHKNLCILRWLFCFFSGRSATMWFFSSAISALREPCS